MSSTRGSVFSRLGLFNGCYRGAGDDNQDHEVLVQPYSNALVKEEQVASRLDVHPTRQRTCCSGCGHANSLKVRCAAVAVRSLGGEPELMPCGDGKLQALRDRIGEGSIVAVREYWQPIVSRVFPCALPSGLHHSFAVLEVQTAAGCFEICLEKVDDTLEVIFGTNKTMRSFALKTRATGELRPDSHRQPLLERSRTEVPTGKICVDDLCKWVEGLLSKVWHQHGRFDVNGQHFVVELHSFLAKHRAVSSFSGCQVDIYSDSPRSAWLADVGFANGEVVLNEERRNLILSNITGDGLLLEFLPEALRQDPELAMAAVNQNWRALGFVPEAMRTNPDILREAILQDWQSFALVSAETRQNRNSIIDAIQADWRVLAFAAPELKADREIVLMAIARNGFALLHAAPELRADKDIVLAAVKKDWSALEYADPALRADRRVMLTAFQQYGKALEYAHPELQADRLIVCSAVSQDWRALEYASAELKADHDIVLRAVQQDAFALLHASQELRKDKDFILAAIKVNKNVLQIAAPDLCGDRDFFLEAAHQNGYALQYAAEELKADREVVLAAVQRNGEALQFAARECKADREIVLAAVSQDGGALQYASHEVKHDRRIVHAAVQQLRNGLGGGHGSERVHPQ